MNKKEYFLTGAIFTLMFILFVMLFGIILNVIGYSDVNVTSWRYWVGMMACFMPMAVPVFLNRNNISLTSILGRMIYFYVTGISYLMIYTFIGKQSIDLWQVFIWVVVFSILYPCLMWIMQHPWTQGRIQSIKNYFSRK